ncbi:MAG: hypothetical protein Q9170_007932 [Blastenia crenularia]
MPPTSHAITQNISKENCPSQEAMQGVAHAYGIISLDADIGRYSDISEVLHSKQNHRYYHRTERHRQQLAYRFNEHDPRDEFRSYPFFTNRTVTAESLNCSIYDEIRADEKDPTTFRYSSPDRSFRGAISIPKDYLGKNGTTYIYRGYNSPESAPKYSCGDRCVKMLAYKNHPRNGSNAFYECSVSVSAVANASEPQHDIPNKIAKLAAAAIAVQGHYKGAEDNRNYQQYTFYASGSEWDIHGAEIDEIGDRFAHSALGSLATMAVFNPRIQLPGHVPHLGHKIHVYEPYFSVLLGCIVGAHFALFAATVYWIVRGSNMTTNAVGMHPLGEQGDESRQNLVEEPSHT